MVKWQTARVPVISAKDGFLLEDPLNKTKEQKAGLPGGPKPLPYNIEDIMFREHYLIEGTEKENLKGVFAWYPWENKLDRGRRVKGLIHEVVDNDYHRIENPDVLDTCDFVLAKNLSGKYGHEKASIFLSDEPIARFASPRPYR